MAVVDLFPFMKIVYAGPESVPDISCFEDCLEVSWCKKGNCGYRYGDKYYCLSAGDILVRRSGECKPEYPGGIYEGITLLVSSGASDTKMPEFLEGIRIDPEETTARLCSSGSYITPADDKLKGIFSEISDNRESMPIGWLRIKALELLDGINSLSPEDSCSSSRCCSVRHADVIKEIKETICSDLNRHYTIEQLSETYRISPTKLKQTFRMIYGFPVYSYIRAVKMRSAAKMLLSTDRTVLDIACEYGYDNGSKFAKAFRDVIGTSPREYRQSAVSKRSSLTPSTE